MHSSQDQNFLSLHLDGGVKTNSSVEKKRGGRKKTFGLKKRGEEEKSIKKKTGGGGKTLNDTSNAMEDVGVSKKKKRGRKAKKRGEEKKSISVAEEYPEADGLHDHSKCVMLLNGLDVDICEIFDVTPLSPSDILPGNAMPPQTKENFTYG